MVTRHSGAGKSLFGLMAAGMGGVLGAACATPAPQQPVAEETPLQIAQALDGIIQPEFQKDAGKFGYGRFLIQGHDNVYAFDMQHVPQMKPMLRKVEAAGRPYAVEFLHCAHKPGRFVKSQERPEHTAEFKPAIEALILPGHHLMAANGEDSEQGAAQTRDWDRNQQPQIAKAVLKVVPQLRRGRQIQATAGDWFVLMSPVRAAKASCLGCHKGAKEGDTLGVMIYAVAQKSELARK